VKEIIGLGNEAMLDAAEQEQHRGPWSSDVTNLKQTPDSSSSSSWGGGGGGGGEGLMCACL
jgi:hypothetical protein